MLVWSRNKLELLTLFCTTHNKQNKINDSVLVLFIKWWWQPGFNPLGPNDGYMNWVCIGLGSGLSSDMYQAIIWTNVALLPIEPFWIHFTDILTKYER